MAHTIVYSYVMLLMIQTGSGKTFTITGGAERYADRGIIPRSLSYIFDYYDKVKSSFSVLTCQVHVELS